MRRQQEEARQEQEAATLAARSNVATGDPLQLWGEQPVMTRAIGHDGQNHDGNNSSLPPSRRGSIETLFEDDNRTGGSTRRGSNASGRTVWIGDDQDDDGQAPGSTAAPQGGNGAEGKLRTVE